VKELKSERAQRRKVEKLELSFRNPKELSKGKTKESSKERKEGKKRTKKRR
jgi:hypothetical protein